jgi:hypothetical protein
MGQLEAMGSSIPASGRTGEGRSSEAFHRARAVTEIAFLWLGRRRDVSEHWTICNWNSGSILRDSEEPYIGIEWRS